jgi:hypothetical protein
LSCRWHDEHLSYLNTETQMHREMFLKKNKIALGLCASVLRQ